jgi:hypothetical protein
MVKSLGIGILGALFLSLCAGTAPAEEVVKAPNGKPVFVKYKCRACHSIESQGIAKKADAGEAAETSEKKPPDLSGVGVKHPADWIAAFLMKKEMVNGGKHEKKFRGTEAELKTLSGWLETLKEEKAAAKLEKSEKSDEKSEETSKGAK